MDVKGSLTRKLGPLPAWAWGLLLGGAIIAARAILARRDGSDGAPVDDPGTSAAEGAAGGSGGGAAGVPAAATNPGSWNVAPDPPVSTITEEPAPATNEAWLRQATTAVVKATGVSQAVVSDALSKVLAGQGVTPIEENYYSRAVAAIGYPPAGAPAIVRAGTTGGGATAPVPGQQGPPVSLPPAFTLFAINRQGQVLYSKDKPAGASYEPEATAWMNDANVSEVRVTRDGKVAIVRGPRQTGPTINPATGKPFEGP